MRALLTCFRQAEFRMLRRREFAYFNALLVAQRPSSYAPFVPPAAVATAVVTNPQMAMTEMQLGV